MIEAKATDSLPKLKRQIMDMAERGADLRPAFESITDELLTMQRSYLNSVRWTPLSAEYAARKARQGFGTRTGVRTGDMFDSLTKKGDPLHVERFKPDSLYFGTKDPVAKLFHGGTYRDTPSGAPNRQPKRKLIRLLVRDRKRLLAQVRDYLLEPVR
jgi:hypothetical protein